MTGENGSRPARWLSWGLTLAWLAAAALAGATPAIAAPPPSQPAAPASPAVSALLARALRHYGAVTVLRTQPAPGGMTAALVEAGGQKAIVWIIGGQAVAVGRMWDGGGHDLNHAMAIRMGLIPPPMAPAAVAAAVAKSQTFVLGTKGPELTVFMDPNCIFCHRLYQAAQPLLAQGKLRLRVVMVGFLKPSSPGRAAAILMAPDPSAALATDETGFDTQHEEGGIAPPTAISPGARAALTANATLLARTGVEATPTLLYRDTAGAWHIMHHGPAEGLAAFVAKLPG